MADISAEIAEIRNAVYGEEVRESFIDALIKINTDNESYQDIKDQVRADKNAVDSKVDEFADLIEDVMDAKDTIIESLASAETAKTQLATAVSTANTAKDALQTKITSASGADSQLASRISSANTAITNAGTAKDALDGSISSANTAKSGLDTSISDANTKSTTLQSQISTAQQTSSNLGNAMSAADAKKSQLQSVISDAGTAQTSLSEVVTGATNRETSLSSMVSQAGQLSADLLLETADAGQCISDLDDRLEDADEILTGVEDLKAYLGYTDEDIVGLQVDFANKTFSRLAGAYGKTAGANFDAFPMYGGRRRCNVANDGTINAYYGDADYVEDGTNGQVMVYQPCFWYKVVPLITERNTNGLGYHIRKANYYVSSRPKVGFKRHPLFYDAQGNAVDYVLLSAYEGSMYDVSESAYVNDSVDTSVSYGAGDLLCSVAGKKPISSKLSGVGTKAQFETMANNLGSGWHLNTIKAENANQLLMMIELGTLNTQTAIGRGVVDQSGSSNASSLTGSTASLGNATGMASSTIAESAGTETTNTTNGKLSVSYRGVENPWGNIWKHTNGINLWGDGTMGGGQVFICDDFTYNESKHDGNYQSAGFSIANGSGYISAFGYGSEDYDWVLMPSEVTGNSSLPVGDYCYVTSNLNGYRIALLGGAWVNGAAAGGFCWLCVNAPGLRSYALGGRLLYVPTATL